MEIISKTKDELFNEMNRIIENYEKSELETIDIEKEYSVKIGHILSSQDVKKLASLINDREFLSNINYNKIVSITEKVKELYETLSKAKDDIEIETFYKNGMIVNFDKLINSEYYSKIRKKFPNMDITRYKQWVNNPPLELKNYKGQTIRYEKFVIKKLIIAIHEMLFNEMDLYIIITGKEGSGKTCYSSQIVLYLYTLLFICGLITYKYDFRNMIFPTLGMLLSAMNRQAIDDYFRILSLDEGNELNRQNFREPENIEYKQSMRTDRKRGRIMIIDIQQLAELDTTITLSRANFVFFCDMENDLSLGLLKKGIADMYIFPRAKWIYSEFHKRNLRDSDILNEFSEKFDKKTKYYSPLPESCLIKKFDFDDIWGFDKDAYDNYVKRNLKIDKVKSKFDISDSVAKIIANRMPELRTWGFNLKDNADKKQYYLISAFYRKCRERFKPELLEDEPLKDPAEELNYAGNIETFK